MAKKTNVNKLKKKRIITPVVQTPFDHIKLDSLMTDKEFYDRITAILTQAKRMYVKRERGLVYKKTWRNGYVEKKPREVEGHYAMVLMRPETKPKTKNR